MASPELLSCPNPWCTRERSSVLVCNSSGSPREGHRVVCTSCGLLGPDIANAEIGSKAASTQAITAWNTREPSSAEARVGVLEGAIRSALKSIERSAVSTSLWQKTERNLKEVLAGGKET